uniref:Uncharacterized protein n=1 Tax=Leersia perrieri TaxID=77586 RepID=A0A0D9XDA2_9ORYZ
MPPLHLPLPPDAAGMGGSGGGARRSLERRRRRRPDLAAVTPGRPDLVALIPTAASGRPTFEWQRRRSAATSGGDVGDDDHARGFPEFTVSVSY